MDIIDFNEKYGLEEQRDDLVVELKILKEENADLKKLISLQRELPFEVSNRFAIDIFLDFINFVFVEAYVDGDRKKVFSRAREVLKELKESDELTDAQIIVMLFDFREFLISNHSLEWDMKVRTHYYILEISETFMEVYDE